MTHPPLLDLIASAKRELTRRQTVYSKVVREGRMTQQQADHEIECQRAIIKVLERAWHLEEVSKEMMEAQC